MCTFKLESNLPCTLTSPSLPPQASSNSDIPSRTQQIRICLPEKLRGSLFPRSSQRYAQLSSLWNHTSPFGRIIVRRVGQALLHASAIHCSSSKEVVILGAMKVRYLSALNCVRLEPSSSKMSWKQLSASNQTPRKLETEPACSSSLVARDGKLQVEAVGLQ